MDETRIQRALREGPPEPFYQPVNLRVRLMAEDRRTRSRSTRLRLGTAWAASLAALAAGILVAVLILREPSAPPPGGMASPSPSASALVSAATGLSATPPATPGASPIAACQLRWSLGRVEGAAGSRYINTDAVNHGPGSCTIAALVGVKLVAGDGSVIAQSTGGNAPTVRVAPGGHVTGFVQWTNWCPARPPAAPVAVVISEVDPPVTLGPVDASSPPLCNATGKPSAVSPLQLSSVP